MTLLYPLINGHRFSYASIELNVFGMVFMGVKAINYSDKLTPGKARGTASMPLGRTRGDYESEASLELFKEEAIAFQARLVAIPPFGVGEVPFVATIAYAELAGPITVDVLSGCRVTSIADAHQQGTDPLTVKFDIDPWLITRNGTTLVSPIAVLK